MRFINSQHSSNKERHIRFTLKLSVPLSLANLWCHCSLGSRGAVLVTEEKLWELIRRSMGKAAATWKMSMFTLKHPSVNFREYLTVQFLVFFLKYENIHYSDFHDNSSSYSLQSKKLYYKSGLAITVLWHKDKLLKQWQNCKGSLVCLICCRGILSNYEQSSMNTVSLCVYLEGEKQTHVAQAVLKLVT